MGPTSRLHVQLPACHARPSASTGRRGVRYVHLGRRTRVYGPSASSAVLMRRSLRCDAPRDAVAGGDLDLCGDNHLIRHEHRRGGSRNLEVIRDGVFPPVGSRTALSSMTLQRSETHEDWIGYQFSSARRLNPSYSRWQAVFRRRMVHEPPCASSPRRLLGQRARRHRDACLRGQ